MKKCIVVAGLAAFANMSMFAGAGAEWPSARHFEGEHLLRVALPMGGIGTGSIALSGRGEFVDWEIMNRANKGRGGDDLPGNGRRRGEGREGDPRPP